MASEPEAYQHEILAEEEPRYLRRQRPVEIQRRKFGRRSWQLYRRVLAGGALTLVGSGLLYVTWDFFLHSPRVALADLERIQVTGNHYVARAAVLEKFATDRGRSVLRVPLDQRRRAVEEIPWVERASIARALPDRVRVELVERTPVAFLRAGPELALVDAYGVILKRPLQGEFRFPVVTGISEGMSREPRERRMRLYVQFLKDIELVRAGAAEQVSEVDLSEGKDLRAVLTGIPGLGAAIANDAGVVLVHFGDGDFINKFRIFVENIGQWRAAAGRVESVDLRFARQVVVNPERKTSAARTSQRFGAAGRPRR